MIEPIVGSNGVILYPAIVSSAAARALRPPWHLLDIRRGDDGIRAHGSAPLPRSASTLRPISITFAKGVTSAYVPLGGVALRESLAAHFDHRALPSGHTFSGHPLAMAAGVATLRAYADEALFERANEIEAGCARASKSLARRHRVIGETRGVGAFFGIELVADRESRAPLVEWQGSGTLANFFNELVERGLYVLGRYNVAIVAPPLTIAPARARRGIRDPRRCIARVGRGVTQLRFATRRRANRSATVTHRATRRRCARRRMRRCEAFASWSQVPVVERARLTLSLRRRVGAAARGDRALRLARKRQDT